MEESFIKRYWRALTIIVLIIGTLLNIYMVFTDFCKQSVHSGYYVGEKAEDTIDLLSGNCFRDTFVFNGKVEYIELNAKAIGCTQELDITIKGNDVIHTEHFSVANDDWTNICIPTYFDGNQLYELYIENLTESGMCVFSKASAHTFGTDILLGIAYSVSDLYRSYSWIIISFFILLSFVCLFSCIKSSIFTDKEHMFDAPCASCNGLTDFVRVTMAITGFVILVLRFPYIILGGGAYYEIPELYIQTAISDGIRSILYADAGYWPLPARLLSVISVNIFRNSAMAVGFVNIVVYFTISLIITKFLEKDYEDILPLHMRYLVVFGLLSGGLLIRCEQMVTLLNVGYFCFFLSSLYLLSDMEKMNRTSYVFAICTNALLISKATLLAMLPGFVIIMLLSMKKKKYKKALYSLSACVCLIIQAIYIVINSMNEVENPTDIHGMIIAIQKSIAQFITVMANTLLNNRFPYSFRIAVLALVFVITICCLVKTVKAGKDRYIVVVFFSGLAAFGNVFLDVFSRNIISRALLDKSRFNYEWFSKNVFGIISFSCILLIFLLSFFYKLINSERIKAFLALSLFSFPLVNCYYEEHTASIEGGYTTWAIESENSQCIPINANGFWARRGNQKLRWYGNECFAQKNLNIGVSIADEWNVITEKKYVHEIQFDNYVDITTLYCEKASVCQADDIIAIITHSTDNDIQEVHPLEISNANCRLIYNINISDVSQIRFVDEGGGYIDIVASFYIVSEDLD